MLFTTVLNWAPAGDRGPAGAAGGDADGGRAGRGAAGRDGGLAHQLQGDRRAERDALHDERVQKGLPPRGLRGG